MHNLCPCVISDFVSSNGIMKILVVVLKILDFFFISITVHYRIVGLLLNIPKWGLPKSPFSASHLVIAILNYPFYQQVLIASRIRHRRDSSLVSGCLVSIICVVS